jgi:hypothetical protein
MKLYQATRDGVSAGFEVSDAGFVKSAAPILGGAKQEGKLGWWLIKRLEAKGYRVELVKKPSASKP